ncbi:MAG: RuBisCO large subunit C-terminal-like domain-containing protein [Chloroflexota bacterium]
MTRVELVATYLADLPPGREHEAAEAFATGQTIGTWTPVPGITDAMRAGYGGRVIELRPLAPDEVVAGEPVDGSTSLLRIGFPTVNFGPQFPMLITTLLGNDPSTSIAARLVDIDVPGEYVSAFPGPRHGTAGWREITGVDRRPIVINMIKPCTGYPPEVGARFVEESARGGVDLIKDDELLADPTFARVADRARAYAAALDRVADDTGHRARYVANVTTRSARLIDTASSALDGGADALMVNGLATGLDAVQALAEADLGVPILVHTAGIETFTTPTAGGYGHRLLLGRLARLAGADAVLSSTPWAPRPLEMSRYRAVLEGCRDDWHGLRPSLPMVGGGIRADHVRSLVEVGGMDLMIGVGGAIQGHPDGTTVGGQVVMQAVDEAVQRFVGATA